MKRSLWLWIIALLLTVVSARWQRLTGPTHELPGDVRLGGTSIHYVLQRTHKGPGGQPVVVKAPPDVAGTLEWKLRGSQGPWQTQEMVGSEDGTLSGELPHLGPGEKFWYRLRLTRESESVVLPADRPASIRYTGAVPAGVLVPHIFFMFLGMMLSARAGLEALRRSANLGWLTWLTLVILVVGGMVFGPLVIHYAFDVWWTGFPVGNDITDSKTLVAVVAWIAAAIAVGRSKLARAWVGLAAVVTLVVFAIPHSWTAAEPLHATLDAAGATTVRPADGLPPPPAADTTPLPGTTPANP
jgi:hypothetical protein